MSNKKSELSQIFDIRAFENTFSAFLAQADKNAETKKSEGGQTPFGFNKKPKFDGADLSTHYGQGAASKTPYLNWRVVSIYYLTDSEYFYQQDVAVACGKNKA